MHAARLHHGCEEQKQKYRARHHQFGFHAGRQKRC
jgi:hypothetical protein